MRNIVARGVGKVAISNGNVTKLANAALARYLAYASVHTCAHKKPKFQNKSIAYFTEVVYVEVVKSNIVVFGLCTLLLIYSTIYTFVYTSLVWQNYVVVVNAAYKAAHSRKKLHL